MSTENPQYAARAGLLRMARQWRDTGSTHQAIDAVNPVAFRKAGGQAVPDVARLLGEKAMLAELAHEVHDAGEGEAVVPLQVGQHEVLHLAPAVHETEEERAALMSGDAEQSHDLGVDARVSKWAGDAGSFGDNGPWS